MKTRLIRIQKPINGQLVKIMPYRKARGNNIAQRPEGFKGRIKGRIAIIIGHNGQKDESGCRLVTLKLLSENNMVFNWRLSSLRKKPLKNKRKRKKRKSKRKSQR